MSGQCVRFLFLYRHGTMSMARSYHRDHGDVPITSQGTKLRE